MKQKLVTFIYPMPALFKKMLIIILIFLSYGMSLSGCVSPSTNQTRQDLHTSPTAEPDEKIEPTDGFIQTNDPLPETPGPFLLIQNDLTDLIILDLSTGTSLPFNPPARSLPDNLRSNLSPGGGIMFFLLDEGTILLTDLVSGQILGTYTHGYEENNFEPDLILQEAHGIFAEKEYSDDTLLVYITKAHQESLNNIQWYQNDQSLLIPIDSGSTGSNLSLFDLNNESFVTLERQPGLVLDYWIGPDNGLILLKKGYVNEPGFWQDKRYYVINVSTKSIKPIPSPNFIDNPNYFWVDTETIGIIHNMLPTGGNGFSTYDVNNDYLSLISEGIFSHISKYGEDFLLLHGDQEPDKTILSLISTQGELISQKTLDTRCYYKSKVNQFILLNCEYESILLDETLNFMPFDGLVSLFAAAPRGDTAILVTRDEESYQINLNTLARESLILQGNPLEIRWLPDASGFLYRTTGKLYIYDIVSGESSLLLDSQSLGDYTNINAVWIKIN